VVATSGFRQLSWRGAGTFDLGAQQPGTPKRWCHGSEMLTPGLVNIEKTNWKMAIEIVDLAMKHGDFPVRYVNVYQRVKHSTTIW